MNLDIWISAEKYANSVNRSKAFEEEEELTLEIVKEKGLENFPEDEIQVLCSKMIRETNYENDDFLTYVCYDLFKKKPDKQAPVLSYVHLQLHQP